MSLKLEDRLLFALVLFILFAIAYFFLFYGFFPNFVIPLRADQKAFGMLVSAVVTEWALFYVIDKRGSKRLNRA